MNTNCQTKRNVMTPRLLLVTLVLAHWRPHHVVVDGLVSPNVKETRSSSLFSASSNIVVPSELEREVLLVAERLWGGSKELQRVVPDVMSQDHPYASWGEASLPASISYSERAIWWEEQACTGDARAQHSLGLVLWSGFGISTDEVASAKWHAAAAAQNHLDGMVLLGGCLRTGTGVPTKDVTLGLQLIDYCAQQWNPTGVNKKAALLEADDDYRGAVDLYTGCLERGNANALLLFNLGYCLVHGDGIDKKDVQRGEELWKEAAAMAPDEGSEEASWFLYQQYARDDEREAWRWLQLAADLGYEEAESMLTA
jgi:TPR repeat protein